MNIFYLDRDINKCAEYLCDSHTVKMPIEYAQLLSSAMDSVGLIPPYKPTHQNHPCAIWARHCLENYQWLFDLAISTGAEYTRRYGKIHKATECLSNIPRDIPLQSCGFVTKLPNCTSIKPTKYNLVDTYRLYYLTDKAHILKYTNRERPDWMGDRFYQQQIEVLGKNPKERKRTKLDIAQSLGIEGLKSLLLQDLEKLEKVSASSVKLDMPEGRLKAPFISECSKINSSIEWSKLTVATLKLVIEVWKEPN